MSQSRYGLARAVARPMQPDQRKPCSPVAKGPLLVPSPTLAGLVETSLDRPPGIVDATVAAIAGRHRADRDRHAWPPALHAHQARLLVPSPTLAGLVETSLDRPPGIVDATVAAIAGRHRADRDRR